MDLSICQLVRVMHRKIIFPGTFDPITQGHLALIHQAIDLFDEVVVGVAAEGSKNTYFSFEERLALVENVIDAWPQVYAKGFHGLTADFYRAEGACALLRGVRDVQDFAYEFQMAQVNQQLNPILKTVLLMPPAAHVWVSASMVREIARAGGDVSAFVPPAVAARMRS